MANYVYSVFEESIYRRIPLNLEGVWMPSGIPQNADEVVRL